MSTDSGDVAERILVTGFEPFGGDDVNPSAMLAQALDGSSLLVRGRMAPVFGRVLPCAFEDALLELRRALDETRPSLVLCTGLAVGREGLTFERVAINLVDARIPDNRGLQPVDARVVKSSVDAHFSGLPVKAMVQAANDAGVTASLSMSAGTYVCNAVFFALMHRLAALNRASRSAPRLARAEPRATATRRRPAAFRGGFMHVAMLPAQEKRYGPLPNLPFDFMLEGTRAALTAAVLCNRDLAVVGGTIA